MTFSLPLFLSKARTEPWTPQHALKVSEIQTISEEASEDKMEPWGKRYGLVNSTEGNLTSVSPLAAFVTGYHREKYAKAIP